MPSTPEDYAGRVRRVLPAFFGPVEVAATLPSTMARAAELAAAGAAEGAMVVADAQSAGRGRLGRSWVAAPGRSLLFTVVLRPRLAPAQAWLVTAAAGVALADAAEAVLAEAWARRERGGAAGGAAAPPRVGLKWPNDLEIAGRKAAGLLAEARSEGGRLDWLLVGVGVNVDQRPGDFPPELAGRATSLSLAAEGAVDRVALLGGVAERFVAGYRPLAAGETGPTLAAYRARLDTLGRRVRAELLGGEPVSGVAAGLGPAGGLVIRTRSGEVEVASADVEHLRVPGRVAG